MSAETSIILFYKYHPLSSNSEIAEIYRLSLLKLCTSLELSGRILVASSDSEGINGTLAGSKPLVEAFTHALLGPQYLNDTEEKLQPFLQRFWQDCSNFSRLARVPTLTMVSPDDFKWSTSDKSPAELFPDLNIKLVNELIGTGGLLSQIAVEETSQGYLTPTEWHEALRDRNPDDSILIDCRNTKECQIGHFHQAVDPGTTTFCQFPQWVRDNQSSLEGKKVFMYCTGGIRCEKASAYIRKVVSQVKEVHHLKGGIHKYLEAFPNRDSLWKGKNFVFDGRTSQLVTPTGIETNGPAHHDMNTIVGQCIYCNGPFDSFHPENVCTVCREPTLVCHDCKRREIHCRAHFHLRNCYFHDLTPFTKIDLRDQLRELEHHLGQIAIGRKFKQKRKTLQKQCDKIRAFIDDSQQQSCGGENLNASVKCRNCGDSDCSGACWGFHGLKRKERLEDSKRHLLPSDKKSRIDRRKANERTSKESRRHLLELEILQQGLKAPASSYRESTTGLRIPYPCVRVIETNVKGKWCGKSVLDVVRQEFVDVYNDLDNVLSHGLLRVNHVAVSRENNVVLKNMDAIQRLVHWHEPPILVPPTISVKHVQLPRAVILECNLADDSTVLVCDKPTTVPVHPTGPYLANSLTVMVEAQEGLANALKPCHRLDRATSGLTICATDVRVSRLIQGTMMEEGGVKKLYVAKVHGKFDADKFSVVVNTTAGDVQVTVLDVDNGIGMVQICAPIEVADPSAGIRRIASSGGKECASRFRLVHYNEKEGTSLVVCHPITGRGHQLRVHLKSLGYPIVGDSLYGGWNIGDAEIPNDVVIAGIQNSLEERRIDGRTEENSTSISAEDVRAVESSCRSCRNGRDGIQASFSDAQLLRGGHSIRLHALRYEMVFRKPKDPTHVVGTLEMEVELPPWADQIVDAKKLSWLL